MVTVVKSRYHKYGGDDVMKKTYVKPVVSKKVSVSVVVSMACSRGGSGRSYCLRA